MTPTISPLQLTSHAPLAIAGTDAGVWLAERTSSTLLRLAAIDAHRETSATLDEVPVALAASRNLLAVATAEGAVRALDPASGQERWRNASDAVTRALRVYRDQVCSALEGPSLQCHRAGQASRRFSTPDLAAFTLADDGVFWLSARGTLTRTDRDGSVLARLQLPDDARPSGAMTICANALWISAPQSLLLVNPMTFTHNATLAAPEGPIALLAGDLNGRLYGGERGVFVFDPAADALVRSTSVRAASPLCGLTVSGVTVWALESGPPVVHIFEEP